MIFDYFRFLLDHWYALVAVAVGILAIVLGVGTGRP